MSVWYSPKLNQLKVAALLAYDRKDRFGFWFHAEDCEWCLIGGFDD